jgi:hypothetical protein
MTEEHKITLELTPAQAAMIELVLKLALDFEDRGHISLFLERLDGEMLDARGVIENELLPLLEKHRRMFEDPASDLKN